VLQTRVIPCLLLKHLGLVKTVKFNDPTYLGDPINIVKIFNDKEVDELIFLDITATVENTNPPFSLLAKITTECFMPLGYGGGIRRIQDVERILSLGVEKIVINSYARRGPVIHHSRRRLRRSQAVVVSIDVKKNLANRYEVFTQSVRKLPV